MFEWLYKMFDWLYERSPKVRLVTSWIMYKYSILYLYGYNYYYILQGKDPVEEYKRLCKEHCERMNEENKRQCERMKEENILTHAVSYLSDHRE